MNEQNAQIDTQLAEDLIQRLADFGLGLTGNVVLGELRPYHGQAWGLAYRDHSAPFTIAYVPSMTLDDMAQVIEPPTHNGPLFLVGDRIGSRSADAFRRLGVSFLDRSGNAHIAFGPVLIDSRGRPHPRSVEDTPRPSAPKGASLFTPKRAQVVFSCLQWPELERRPLRERAHAAGVSIGTMKETLDLLADAGFADSLRRILPHRRDGLISHWAAAFPTGLGRRCTGVTMTGDHHAPAAERDSLYVSGAAAVPELLHADSAIFYSAETPKDTIVKNRWSRTQDNPTIELRKMFWHDPHEAAPSVPGIRPAPWLIVYADLIADGSSRCREAAEAVRSANA